MRLSSLAALCAALVLSGVTSVPAQAAVPPQEPGVTLRVYDVQVELDRLCTLKPGQTPNIDKLMPTIDWSGSAFGIEDFFMSEAIGNINIATAGSYTFRLTSDDGSRMRLDNNLLINNDGLHGSTPVEATVSLTTGYHGFKIEHFDRAGGQQVTLEWRPPGASGFSVVPNSVLSTDAGVVRVTAPGRKECEGGADTPGDGLPLTGVHPDLTLTNLRPNGFQPQVTGMDWLPDGRLAITTWGGSNNVLGEVYLLSNVTGTTSPSRVTTQRIASGLKEPMGIKYVDGKLYVSQKTGLTELNDTNGDWVTDNYRTVATWPFGNNFHEFAFGLLYKDGFFYLNLSVAIDEGGNTTNPQPAPNRGSTLKINKTTGAVSYVAGGLRTPHGIGWGPDGDIFVTDNQGGWLPSSKLVHIKQNRFFNHYMNPPGPFESQPVTQPVLWLPQNEIANSPSNPILLSQGPFAGQFVFGDVTYGGIQRGFVEKVNGEYQGAVFRMTQGLESGVSRMTLGPDGALYTGGIGAGGNWGQEGKLTYGLQKVAFNGNNAFDIKAMRAVAGGFELEYTQPLSTATAQEVASKYQAQQWRYVPTSAYGGPKVDAETVPVTSATVSADRRKVTLKMSNLKAGRVVYVRSPRSFTSESGEQLWSTEAWYTLNALVGGFQDTDLEAEASALGGGAVTATDHTGYSGTGFVAGYWNQGASTTFTVSVPTAGSYQARLRYANGPDPVAGAKTVSLYVNGTKVRQVSLASTGNWDTWATKTDAVTLAAGTNSISYRYDAGDGGNVNLDRLTVGATTQILDTDLEAESSGLGGGAEVATDHAGYSGSGFVAGYWNQGASTTFTVTVPTAGTYQSRLRYSNGPNPFAGNKRVSLYVNNAKVRQISLASTGNWDTWAIQTDVVTLNAGANTVSYRYDAGDDGNVNLDKLTVGAGSRIVLFDGTGLGAWEARSGGAANWPISGGSVESLGGDIRTKQKFGDFRLHVEWYEPEYPPEVTGQARGNSGVFLQERYEVQVLESYGKPAADNEAGSIYSKRAPDANVATPSGTWQTYDITFRAARFDSAGNKTANARVTVVWNGVTVHDNVEINGGTGDNLPEDATPQSIRLQDHGDAGANPRYRNIWIEPLT
ncbi:family 16 glycoside hydrolase [Actinophytocola oryzae]|uniref:Carbohydrate-binding protein with CBM35 doain n=1 Tax=Actinophytocola oryzae TaxID=502181 RepID=A0A4R7VFQ2_9PSEU|nr:family 16 glycoside hydrolase [Actinophytocola oryzae]TDV47858.1 carbohydrate-binding protein with CBM35 doain [Actinophytocola oryzae]